MIAFAFGNVNVISRVNNELGIDEAVVAEQDRGGRL